MKFFGLISAGLISAESTPVPFTFDEASELFGPLETAAVTTLVEPTECCSTLKVWGDIELFTGRFDKSDEVHESFPVYTATRGGLKLFFNTAANRWIVSSNIDDSDVRAIGGSTPCPDQDDDWKVWNGIAFDEPSLEEPWSPYIIAPKVLECRPETFEISDLSTALASKFCDFIHSSDGIHSGRLCREGEKVSQLAFGSWENSTNNFLNSNLMMTVKYIETLDQWHAVVNSIILKRTWESDPEIISSLRNYVLQTINEVRNSYSEEPWAEADSRFLFLQA